MVTGKLSSSVKYMVEELMLYSLIVALDKCVR